MAIKIEAVRKNVKAPERATNFSNGFDLYASCVLGKGEKDEFRELPVTIYPGEIYLIGVGIKMEVPDTWDCEIRPRSGLARKGIYIANGPGTIDPDYRGEVGVLTGLIGKEPDSFEFEEGMRIAQALFHSNIERPVFEWVDEISDTIRGAEGFGSTGLHDIKEGTGEFEKQIKRIDRHFMENAIHTSNRSECVRGVERDEDGKCLTGENGNWINQTRKLGCVIVKNGTIIASGFNAHWPGSEKCAEVGCLRDTENILSGTMIEKCRAVHAEMMALNKLETSATGATIYVNSEPCEICARLIADKRIETAVFLEGTYPQNGMKILKDAGINVRFVSME